ncbi:MAG: cytochrome c oxidase subunit II [Candidatus Tectomicrobia bacterium]|uniref:Cytochrome c oxidase subunit 2 n=1 Tax=Tectimicrobiota bacterium TaxID=2528274 RepID=A0A932GQK0_UNCTE|nr:cytochrome c oxidase subunit II [Candidatus Tectomicrobia bacterium]
MMSWLPENVSSYGGAVDSLFYLVYYITGAVFFLVMGLMIFFLVKYRHREGRRARYSHGNNTLEILWTVVPALILVVLTALSVPTWAKIKSHIPPTDLTIQVIGKQFNWEVTYAGPDGKFGTEDDRTFDNEMHVPVNAPVKVVLLSKDVIHSLFLPNLRFKQDAVPGREIPQWFQATKTGKYVIPCAELCGFGHSGMQGYLYVHTAQEYEQWVKEQWPSS